MKRTHAGMAARYARAIEGRWSELLQQPVVLSRQDWAWVERWHAREIPLEIVEEALEAANERDRERSRPRKLGEIARAIEEAWSVVLDGRRAEEGDSEPPEARPPAEAWRRRLEAERTDSPLGGLLEELLERFEAGDEGEALDRELDAHLLERVETALRQRVEREVEGELEPYRSRMAAQRWESTRRRACIERLRRRLDLPRLAHRSSPA